MAGQVAEGSFFERLGEKGNTLRNRCVVIFVDCDEETIKERRMRRDGNNYDEEKYKKSDGHDRLAFEKYQKHYKHVIQNPNGENDAVEQVVNLLLEQLQQA